MDETIKVTGLSKSYAGNKVISNIELSIGTGQVFDLLGANGTGKTTTIECILGTRKADAGSVSILGLDPRKDRKQLFEQVGFLKLHANLLKELFSVFSRIQS